MRYLRAREPGIGLPIAYRQGEPNFISHPGPPFLDSSFRWNDDGVLFWVFVILVYVQRG